MATAIQLEITLDSSSVATGAENVKTQLAGIAPASAPALKQVSSGFNGIESAERRAHTAALLFTRTTGVEMPRALENVIAKSRVLGPLLAGAFNAAVIGAAVGAFGAFAEKLRDLSEEAGGFTSEVKDLNKQMIEANNQALANPKTLANAEEHQRAVKQGLESAKELNQTWADLPIEIKGAINIMRVYNSQVQDAYEKMHRVGDAQKLNDDTVKNSNALVLKIRHDSIEAQSAISEAGLKGLALLRQQHIDQDKIITDTYTYESGLSDLLAIKKKENDAKYFAARKQLQQQYAEAATRAEEQAEESTLKGEAAIRVSEEHRIGDLVREMTLRDSLSQREVVKSQEFQDRRAAIEKEADYKITELRRQATEKAVEMESQAAVASLPEWQRADAQILIDYQRTIRQIDQEVNDTVITEAAGQRERAAAWALANAHIRDEHRRLTIDLGQDLESIYDDIGSGNLGKRILNNMKKLFFQIVAEWLLATKTMGGIFGKLFGTLLGGPQSTLENASGGGLGSLFGLFGAPAAANVSGGLAGGSAAGGTAGGPSALTSALGLGGFFGGSAVPGTAAAGFGAAGALTTSSIASSGGGIGAVAGGALGAAATGGASKSIFGTALGGLKGAAGLAALLPALFGGALGGKIGQIGGTLFSSAFLLGPLLAHLGISSAIAPLILGPLALAGGGLLGFGIGQKFGTPAGIFGGAGTGAGLGFLVGGPIGAAIGAIIGLLGGLFGGLFGGSKRKKQANALFDNQIGPAIKKIEDDYKGFSIDFSTANQELEDLRKQAEDSLGKLKGQGKDVFRKKVTPAIDLAEKEIAQLETERERRAGLVFGPPQFHEGGFVSAAMQPFMRPGEIMALLKHGEFVVNPQATRRSRTQLEQINAGRAVGGGTLRITINALDARSVEQWLRGGGAQKIQDGLDRLSKEGN